MDKSETVTELVAALAKAQGSLEPAPKDAENPHLKSKYADLASVWGVARAPLAENGLSIVQTPEPGDDGVMGVRTTLFHSSGQFLSSFLPMPIKGQSIQDLGSAITYARRYGMSAMLGIVSGQDDDGHAASQQQGQGARRESRPNGQDRAPAPPAQPTRTVVEWAKDQVAEANDWYTASFPGKVLCASEWVLMRHLAGFLQGTTVTDNAAASKFLKGIDEAKIEAIKVESETFLFTYLPSQMSKGLIQASPPVSPMGDTSPAPAEPANGKKYGEPKTGKALFAWTKEMEQKAEVGLLNWLNSWGGLQDFPARIVDWDADQVVLGYSEALRKLDSLGIGVKPDGTIVKHGRARNNEAYEEALAN